MAMTVKKRRFVEEYLVDFNASAAARRAGYSVNTAGSMGNQLLKDPEIKTRIEAAIEKQAERTGVTADAVVAELARVGFADVRKLFQANGSLRSLQELPLEIAACIRSVDVVTRSATDDSGERVVEYVEKIRLHDKLKSLELLGKRLQMWENHEGGAEDVATALTKAIKQLPN